MPHSCLPSCETVRDRCYKRLWRLLCVEGRPIPSIRWLFIADNAANGSWALVPSGPFVDPIPSSPLEDPETMAFTWVSSTLLCFLVSCLMCMVIRLSCHPGFL